MKFHDLYNSVVSEGKKKDKKHDCAKHVHHESYGQGECIHAKHARPDDNGYVSWYTVMFEHGPEVVNTNELKILMSEVHTHGGSMKKKK